MKSAAIILICTFVMLGSGERDKREHRDQLDLELEASRVTITADTQATLRATIKSHHDVPVHLYVGTSPGGVVFESGSAYRMHYYSESGVGAEVHRTPLVASCARGSEPVFIKLKGSKGHAIEITAGYKKWMGGEDLFVIGGNTAFLIESPCTVAVWIEHEASADNYSLKFWHRPDAKTLGPKDPIWIGEVKSNPVVFEITSGDPRHPHSN